MDSVVLGLISVIISLWLGSIEIRMRNVRDLIGKVPSREEMKDEIAVRQEALKVLTQEIKEDIKELKLAIDKLANK
jgi:DnaJ-domain-containing protein 1